MKKFKNEKYQFVFFVTLLSTDMLYSSLSSTEITHKVLEIKEERSGISLSKLEGTLNPFMIRKKKVHIPQTDSNTTALPMMIQVQEESFTLSAILNNKAFINGKWYKQGDKLGSYKVGYVSKTGLLLRSKTETKKLILKKKKKNFIKLNRGYR